MKSFSFRTALMLRITVVIAVTMTVVGAFTYLRVQETSRQQAKIIIRETTGLIKLRVKDLTDKAEDQSKLFADTYAFSIDQGGDLRSMAKEMVRVLRANDQFGLMRATIDKTGECVVAQQLPNGELEATVFEDHDGKRVVVHLKPFGEELRETSSESDWKTDLRATADYAGVKASPNLTWTRASSGQPGYLVSEPVTGMYGDFAGVVQIELATSDLDKFVGLIPVGRSGIALIIDDQDKGTPAVAAFPATEGTRATANAMDHIPSLNEVGDPRLVAYTIARSGKIQSGEEASQFSFGSGGISYFGSSLSIGGTRLPTWNLGIIVPQDEFAEGPRQIIVFFVAFVLLALGVGAIMAMVMARRVSLPLSELVREAEHIQNLQLAPRPFARTGISEIDDLSSAMERMKASLRSLEKLVPGDYARHLMSSGLEAKLGGERRHITTYFGDIVGFTALSQDLAPEDLMDVLSEYLEVLSTQVLNHEGTIDKFNGDDVMAFWGAPSHNEDHAFLACKSALNSLKAIAALHTEWRDHGRPMLLASFGIATGDVIVGNVGSGQRMNYTVIGDSVNMASRLQGANKFFGTHILIGEGTLLEAGDRICARWVDRIKVSGRDKPEDVFELLAVTAEATPNQLLIRDCHARARESYLSRDWATAEFELRKVMALDPHDGASSIMIARIYEYRQQPPPQNWDGSHPLMGK